MGFLQRLKDGLKKTKESFVNQVTSIFTGRTNIDDELFEELEEVLIQADVGVKTTFTLIDKLKEDIEEEEITEPEELMEYFQKELQNLLQNDEGGFNFDHDLNIIMVVGVNGAGKTTTIAKIAGRHKEEGKKVMLAAGDTFRAGAIEQLQIWGDRLGINVIAQQEGSDAAAVAYDAVQSAKARDVDLLIIDTAGRLHTQTNLMEELKKVKRVIDREAAKIKAGVEVLLVLDATTGQNAISQAKLFNDAVEVDGVALTKLDGTAKGGIVIAVKNELDIPIKLIGVGEAAEDLQNFDPEEFI
ncbi:MAG: signal recognition particle-docking protein FtsY, partial [Halanaerobium sp.]